MPSFDGRRVEGPTGAVLYLQQPAQKTSAVEVSGATVSTSKGSRALMLAHSQALGAADETLEFATRAAQQGLDLWAITGRMTATLASAEDENIVWWAEDGGVAARIWCTCRFDFHAEVGGISVFKDGKPVPPTLEPPLEWHPSFRYFRLGQAPSDLVEAFRNYYLALESLLSTLEPMEMRDGIPAEREGRWLDRALARAATFVDITQYAPHGKDSDAVRSVRADIYVGARTGTFHSKAGAPVLLPHDDQTRNALRDAVRRLRRLYVDLAQAVLGFRFIGGTGLAPAGFRAMTSGVAVTRLYASGLPVDLIGVEAGQLPTDIFQVPACHAEEHNDEYHVAYMGTLVPANASNHLLRQVGALIGDTGRIGIYQDLEGELNADGFTSVQILIAVAAQDPRALA